MRQPVTSSGAIAVTAGQQVVTGAGVLDSAQIISAAAASTLRVYDGTSTSGLLLIGADSAANSSTNNASNAGIVFNTGLFVVVTGAGASGIVRYELN